MQSGVVVAFLPGASGRSGILEAGEPAEVEWVLGEPTVEVFDERVLRPPGQLEDVQFHTSFCAQNRHRIEVNSRPLRQNDSFRRRL